MSEFKEPKNLFDFITFLRINKLQNFSFTSKPTKLRKLHILMQSLASGDFNPAHTRPEYAEKSFFGGIVSHGVGVLARAEGQFVQLFPRLFDSSVEIIALGYEKIEYLSPLRLGDTYEYRFEITDMKYRYARWDFDCSITCKVLKPKARIIARCLWKPSIVEHNNVDAVRFLKPKWYIQSIFNILVLKPALQASMVSVFSFPIIMLFLITVGIIDAPIDPGLFYPGT